MGASHFCAVVNRYSIRFLPEVLTAKMMPHPPTGGTSYAVLDRTLPAKLLTV
jgi:hypothetical protein